jgi:hypothetical protein
MEYNRARKATLSERIPYTHLLLSSRDKGTRRSIEKMYILQSKRG